MRILVVDTEQNSVFMILDDENKIPEQKYGRDFTNWCAEIMIKKTCPNNLHFIMVIDLEI